MPNTITEPTGATTIIASRTLISEARARKIAVAIGAAGVMLKDHSPAVVHYDDAAAAGQWQIIDDNGTVVADAWTLAAMQDGDPNGHWVTIAEGGASGPAWVSNDPTKTPEPATVTNVDLSTMAAAAGRDFETKVLGLLNEILAQINKGK